MKVRDIYWNKSKGLYAEIVRFEDNWVNVIFSDRMTGGWYSRDSFINHFTPFKSYIEFFDSL